MLSQNIKEIRKSKGLSQQELAVKLNVVRQTVSKWEQGRSVPDSEMLISLSEVLETPVSTLLGENIVVPEADQLKEISAKLEVINLQLAQAKTIRRKIIHWSLIVLCAAIIVTCLKSFLHAHVDDFHLRSHIHFFLFHNSFLFLSVNNIKSDSLLFVHNPLFCICL